MLYLLCCIVFSSCLTLAFKVTERYGLNNLQVIVFNYVGCVLLGLLVNGDLPDFQEAFKQPWFPWTLTMGALFISLLSIIGFTAQRSGIAITSVAYKLSLVIPFIFSLYLYGERAGILKIAGIVAALIAIILTCWPGQKTTTRKPFNTVSMVLMPALLFVGSGLLDTIIKYVEQAFVAGSNKNDILISAFLTAAITGLLLLGIRVALGKQSISLKAVMAGLIIGIPNYLSMWCLLQVLKMFPANSSAIIPVNNMAIVLFSSVMAAILFKERLSVVNWSGILLAMGAIVLIAFG